MEIDPNLSEKAKHDFKLVCAALQNADQKAYAELMHRYRDTVYFMLNKMVNNKDDADDLTIEAFAKAFKRLHQYVPQYAFSTWLFKIASNNCIDFMRKKKNGVHFSIDTTIMNDEGGELNIDVRSDVLNPEEKIMKKEKLNAIREVVEKLKPRYKELVEMRYYEEMSYEEISVKMDLPVGTFKAQLFRAREFMQTIIIKMSNKP